MTFGEKLENWSRAEIWEEYCGFLDLSMADYMKIQERLLMEQIELLKNCALGRRFLGNKAPATLAEFRKTVPLTRYNDYADILLEKRVEMLPAPPVTWCQTTWEGGGMPDKVAPYTAAMLDSIKINLFAAMILAASDAKGSFRLRSHANALFTLSPLPFVTGLFMQVLDSDMNFTFFPSKEESEGMSFSKKMELGLKLAVKKGLHQVFGLSSILVTLSKKLQESWNRKGAGSSGTLGIPPGRLLRFMMIKYRCKREKRSVLPKDLFDLDVLVCGSGDSELFKSEIEADWGRRPLQIGGGTETSCLCTEVWSKDGLVLFPDVGFYEFIPESEMQKNRKKPEYKPHVFLLNELEVGEKYELVITNFKGGAFVRYRTNETYRCIRIKNQRDGLDIPQFEYTGTVPSLIDVGGITKITEREIDTILNNSGLPIKGWVAVKEYENKDVYLHLYVELKDDVRSRELAAMPRVIEEHSEIYFRNYDNDFGFAKKMLGMNPLRVTIIASGTLKGYAECCGDPIPRVNPGRIKIAKLLRIHEELSKGQGKP